MASNVYTKNEILQNLADKGFFIDSYTLGTFFEKWKIEAIFEDEQGSEFYDKNALDLVLNNLFSAQNGQNQTQEQEAEPRLIQPKPYNPEPPPIAQPRMPQPEYNQEYTQPQIVPQYVQQMPPQPQVEYMQNNNPYNIPQQPMIQHQAPPQMNQQPFNDPEAQSLLNSISLSDGTPLMNKVQGSGMDGYINYDLLEQEAVADIQPKQSEEIGIEKEKKMGILEGAMLATGQEYEAPSPEETTSSEMDDFDDMSLLSESLEAQEKFREYVVSELSKKNVDLTPKSNEFKLDISERTLNMIARSMAKKIVKYVNQLYGGDPKAAEKFEEVQKELKKLEARGKELEDQNKKLRLLLAESNRNYNALSNSFQPSFFGLYKKVPPQQ